MRRPADSTVWLHTSSLARHCGDNSTTEQGGEAPIRIGHVQTLENVRRLWVAQMWNRSAERWCSQVAAISGFRLHGFRKANGTITKLVLYHNKIGDAGASALAESLRATFVTCVL